MTESEIWKDIVGFEGFYKVSNKGNVRSVARKDTIGRKCGGRSMKPVCNSDGYPCLNLNKDGIATQKKVHRLVLEAFIPNPKNYPEVNHRDEDKTNNNVENLEWCDTRYNINFGARTERVAQKLNKKVRAINIVSGEVIMFNSVKEAGSEVYSKTGVSRACRGAYKKGDGHTYKGYRWHYE